ncbi:hypothetical protein HMPREF0580_0601 [Mobiluncus mulieris ATCC 35239]|uniref:Uncharacterized protein n=1 Tax=Mobiluncus mulieris ATCC 35239 TaxID=871571 RepID=E0QNY7_9ACTO|nr:hypothetical protein HMPREF0580_0601 [Mobiluncus mulieris ATCC 35239]
MNPAQTEICLAEQHHRKGHLGDGDENSFEAFLTVVQWHQFAK